jgi:hypothetical protein
MEGKLAGLMIIINAYQKNVMEREFLKSFDWEWIPSRKKKTEM